MAQRSHRDRQVGKKTDSKVVEFPQTAKKQKGIIDYTFLFIVVLLVAAGLVMLLSASTPTARQKYGNSYYFFTRQFFFIAAGFVGMYITSILDYKIYKKYAKYIFGLALFLIFIVAIPGIGIKINGSRRWLPLPGFNFQPSELMKLAVAVLFAAWIEDGKFGINTLVGSGRYYAVLVLVGILMLLEPHLSGTIVIVGIGMTIMIVSGTPIKPIAIVGANSWRNCVCGNLFSRPRTFGKISSFYGSIFGLAAYRVSDFTGSLCYRVRRFIW